MKKIQKYIQANRATKEKGKVRRLIFHHPEIGYIIATSSRAKTKKILCKNNIIFIQYPSNLSKEESIHNFVKKNLFLIKKFKIKIDNNSLDIIDIETPKSECIKKYINKCREEVSKFLNNDPRIKSIDLSNTKIRIGKQKSLWGSCSSKRTLSFNYKIYFLPRHLFEYVILHELAHLKYMNHKQEYWSYLLSLDDRCLIWDKELNKYRISENLDEYIRDRKIISL